MKPYFSIIIPLFNKENFIKKTIESVLNQSFTYFELLIIDDGSTDNSLKKVSEFDDERIKLFTKKNEGVAIARNFGIQKAISTYICFLDADDIWNVDFLKTIYQYSIQFPSQEVFSTAKEIETKNTVFKPQYSIKKTSDFEFVNFFQASQKECILWTSSVVIHKKVFEKVGVFDTNISKGEDTEMWIRIGLNYQILFIWKALSIHVYDAKSVSRNSNYYFNNYTFNKYFELEKTNLDLKKFMDSNRFSAAIKSKLKGKNSNFKKLISEISWKHLPLKKKIILKVPRFLLLFLIYLKNNLTNFGLGNSVFK